VWIGEFNRRDGKTVPEDEVKQVRLIMTGDRYTVERGGGKASRGTSKLDPTQAPKVIDISIIDGEYKGQHWLGIYELSSDTYRACFATVGKPRPKEFSSEPGSGNVLWIFRREKN
ncbi:MAG: TIGR03067 domain-containing protein, partial [Planctomycetia bacterium]|nr:TIGR03067 domain-containing protein [Planctomycetia bacterium]